LEDFRDAVLNHWGYLYLADNYKYQCATTTLASAELEAIPVGSESCRGDYYKLTCYEVNSVKRFHESIPSYYTTQVYPGNRNTGISTRNDHARI
jgi:hypothetical protein